jgi:hypothetical protein
MLAAGLGIIAIALLFGVVVFFGAPYVPSQKKYIRRVFKYIALGADDLLVDVGSGDGVVLRSASRCGATALGYEINPILVLISKVLSAGDSRVSVVNANFWKAKLPEQTTIVYAFSVTRDEKKLTQLLQREANRLQRPLKLLCLGSPFRLVQPVDSFDAYALYLFQPLQVKNA